MYVCAPVYIDMVEVGGLNPPGPTKFLSICFYWILFFQNRAFWRFSARGHYRAKVVSNLSSISYGYRRTGALPNEGIDLLAINRGLNDYLSYEC